MGAKGIAALLGTVTLLALAPTAQGAAGFPDPSFGVGGFTTLDEPELPNEELADLIVRADGKILGAGRRGTADGFLLARLNADGSADLSFGAGGIQVEPDEKNPGDPRSIAEIEQRPDGKVVAVGLGRGPGGFNAFQFARYLSDGSLDPGFGIGGMRTVTIEPFGAAEALDLAPDQRVVAAGRSEDAVPVVRLTEAGQPDPAFNPAPEGIRSVDVPGTSSEEARAVRVLGDGTILIGGVSGVGAFLAKLDADGEPVNVFGNSGVAVHDLGAAESPSGSIEDLEVLGNGRIVAAGIAPAAGSGSMLIVARFMPNGQLDPSFGSGGIVRRDPTGGSDEGKALALRPDGRILVAGTAGSGDTLLVQLTADGAPDPSFGSGGETVAPVGPTIDKAQGLALQSDGRAVIAGFADEPGTRMLLFGRFTADDPPPRPSPPAPRCRGRDATLVGTNDEDRVTGTPGRDVVLALGGDDKIDTFGGNDLICAGAGIDIVRAGKGRDIADGGAGRDLLFGGPGNDRLFGGPALDLLFGGAGKDLLVGGPGRRDLCNGGAGRRDRARGSCERRKRLP